MPLYKSENGKPRVISSGAGITPTITENKNNTDTEYRLDIKTANNEFTTPNLKGSGESNITISEEAGNTIEQKEDGIYVPPINISEDENNAIVNDENGALYVEDKSEEIEKIQAELSPKVKYHKYLNTELDYLIIESTRTNTLNYVGQTPIVFDLSDSILAQDRYYVDSCGIDYTDTSFSLKAGKTYSIRILPRIAIASKTFATFGLFEANVSDYTYDNVLNNVFGIINTGAATYDWSNKDYENIVTPQNDMELKIVLYDLSSSAVVTSIQFTLIVQEINRQIVIDPVEHINKNNGIEDTPVGHIISHMGTVAPDHYLICDGTEYNIADYPYLAQHFEDQFGTVNNFGGDGITTFKVPDLRGEFLRGSGIATRNTGSGADVGVHQDATENPYIFININNTLVQKPSTNTIVNADKTFGYAESSDNVYINSTGKWDGKFPESYTSRPTNTSVLYCIKYEPTYFMKNSYAGFDRTTLWEGSWILSGDTSLNHTVQPFIDESITLSDDITKYDSIQIEYHPYNPTTQTVSALIASTIVDINSYNINSTVVQCRFIVNSMFLEYLAFKFSTNNTLTADHIVYSWNTGDSTYPHIQPAFKISKVIGIKSASSSESNTTPDYTDEEIDTMLDEVFGGDA